MPRNVIDDWNERVLEGLEARHRNALHYNHKDQDTWRKAIRQIQASTKRISIQKEGNAKGIVKGIPEEITGRILQTIISIVKGLEPIIPPGYEEYAEFGTESESIIKSRKYKDSKYAILAALWTGYTGQHEKTMSTKEVQKLAGKFCNHTIGYDHRNGRSGAWKSKDSLVKGFYVSEIPNGNAKSYCLTNEGAKVCYILFNDKFHPSIDPEYELVEPKRAFSREQIFGTPPADARTPNPVEDRTGSSVTMPNPNQYSTSTSLPTNLFDPVDYILPMHSDDDNDVDNDDELQRALELSKESIRREFEEEAYLQALKESEQEAEKRNDAYNSIISHDLSVRFNNSSSRKHGDIASYDSSKDISANSSNFRNSPPSTLSSSSFIDLTLAEEVKKTCSKGFPSRLKDNNTVIDLIADEERTYSPDGKSRSPSETTTSKKRKLENLSSGQRFLEEDFELPRSDPIPTILNFADRLSDPDWKISEVSLTKYPCEEVPPTCELTLLVDSRERQGNAYYREMYQRIRNACDTYNKIKTTQDSLSIGDYSFIFKFPKDASQIQLGHEEEAPLRKKKKSNEEWSAGVVIERKSISDIIGRSAEKPEGPHFKQERNIRNSGLNHPFMLIEGDCFRIPDTIKPRIWNEQDKENPDVISDREELLSYICGVICRNFGSENIVQVLNPMDDVDTSKLLAAIGAVLQHHYTTCAKPVIAPSYADFSKYWHWSKVKQRREALREQLENVSVSEDMISRIQRRFHDKVSLDQAFDLCENSLIAATLLKDLSIAPSNASHDYDDHEQHPMKASHTEETEEETEPLEFFPEITSRPSETVFDGFGMKKMLDDSLRSRMISTKADQAEILDLQSKLLTDNPQLLSILQSRRTIIKMNQEMNRIMDSFEGYPDYILPSTFNRIDSGRPSLASSRDASLSASREWPWCKIFVRDSLPINDRWKFSDSVCLLVLPGRVVVSALGLTIGRFIKKNRNPNARRPLMGNSTLIKLMFEAIELIERHYPKELDGLIQRQSSQKDKNAKRILQVVWLIENLGGRSIARTGAFGRLDNVLQQPIPFSSSSSSSSSALSSDRVCLDAKFTKVLENPGKYGFQHDLSRDEDLVVQRLLLEKGIISREAGQYLSDQSPWIINLFLVALMFRSSYTNKEFEQVRYQAIHLPPTPATAANDEEMVAGESHLMVSRFVHNMHRLAFPCFLSEN